MINEHRSNPRFPSDVPVLVLGLPGHAGGVERTVTNLSAGGMLVSLPGLVPVGTSLHLRFRPAQDLPEVATEAEVRWTEGRRVSVAGGLRFVNLGLPYRQAIEQARERFEDRRRHRRAPVIFPVGVDADSLCDLVAGRASDVSESGMRLVLDTARSPGNLVAVTLRVQGQAVFQAGASVRWCRERPDRRFDVGVEFQPLDAASRDFVERVLQGPAETAAGEPEAAPLLDEQLLDRGQVAPVAQPPVPAPVEVPEPAPALANPAPAPRHGIGARLRKLVGF